MQISFYATFRPIVGGKTVDIPVPEPSSVAEVVAAIIARFPAMGPILLDENGDVPRGVHFFVNGRGAGYLPEGWQTKVSGEDKLDVFPAVAGG